MKIGLDVGSTTLKCVVLDDNGKILYKSYRRHLAQITETTLELLRALLAQFPDAANAPITVSGSAGMGMAEASGIGFVQEVYATRLAVKQLAPDTDVVIELGGEDAKILYLDGTMEVRMNGSCAGGTGAFIDQMATLLAVTPDDLNTLSHSCEKIYTIASRCGVFAKSDIQPLINQGARKEDIAASIFSAVVNQTIAGLAQGRPIKGRVLYLGGPLTFMDGLREAFDKTLGTKGTCPENSLYFVALGAAFGADIAAKHATLAEAVDLIANYHTEGKYLACPPLFKTRAEYDEFASSPRRRPRRLRRRRQLSGRRLPRYRRRLDYDKARRHQHRRRNPEIALPPEQRQSRAYSARVSARLLRQISEYTHNLVRRHRLRRGDSQERVLGRPRTSSRLWRTSSPRSTFSPRSTSSSTSAVRISSASRYTMARLTISS